MDWGPWWAAHGETVITLIIGALIGAFFDWVFFRKAERPKRLSWEVMSETAIINAGGRERNRLKLAYDGDDVDNPNITVVRIGNTGKREIQGSDFQEPINIDFGAARVVTTEATASSDDGVKATWTSDPSNPAITLVTPELLNSGEWIDIKFVTDGRLREPEVTARFAGQSSPIANLEEKRRRRQSALFLAGCLGVIVMSILAQVIISNRLTDPVGTLKKLELFSITLLSFVALFFFLNIRIGRSVWRKRKNAGRWWRLDAIKGILSRS